MRRRHAAWVLLVHLRLPFQLALSAVFLWGVFCSRGTFDLRTLAAWVACTVFLSGGATAFNSVYDRDRGPVGGLRRPPPVSAALLPFSVAVLAAGFPLALAAGGRVGLLYALASLGFVQYSHPSVRLKARTWPAVAVVALCSGWMCFAAGLFSARGAVPGWPAAAGALASTLFIAGFYPLTQLGHVEEDRERGDRTFAIAYGRRASFRWALAVLGVAGALDVACTLELAGPAPACGLAVALGVLGIRVLRWRRDPDLDGSPLADVLAYASAAVHAAVVGYALWVRG